MRASPRDIFVPMEGDGGSSTFEVPFLKVFNRYRSHFSEFLSAQGPIFKFLPAQGPLKEVLFSLWGLINEATCLLWITKMRCQVPFR